MIKLVDYAQSCYEIQKLIEHWFDYQPKHDIKMQSWKLKGPTVKVPSIVWVQKVKSKYSRCNRSKVHKSRGVKGKNYRLQQVKGQKRYKVLFLGSKVKLVIVKGQLKHCNLEVKL